MIGIDERGKPIDLRDPLAPLLRERADSAGPDPVAQVRALTNIEPIFGTDLPANDVFMTKVTEAYETLHGVRKAVGAALTQT